MPPAGCTVKAEIDLDVGTCNGTFLQCITNTQEQKSYTNNGTFSSNGKRLLFSGASQDFNYRLSALCVPTLQLQEFVIERNAQPLLVAKGVPHHTHKIAAQIALKNVQELAKDLGYPNLQVTGDLHGIFTLNGLASVHADLSYQNGIIRIPQTFTCVTGATLAVDIDREFKTMAINEFSLALQDGTVSGKGGIIALDHTYGIRSLYMPLAFNGCMLRIKKDMWATVSGTMRYALQESKKPLISGALFIDEGCIKQNIFSMQCYTMMRDWLRGSNADSPEIPFDYDLLVETKKPLTFAATIFEGKANIQLRAHNLSGPFALEGTVNLADSVIYFPYKPLYILRGSLTFLPGRLADPLLDIIAHNTIKNYDITAQLIGSLYDYSLWLTANPTLTQEQIVALLLVGSPQASWGTMIPSLATQALKHYLFDSDYSPVPLSARTKEWFKPLRSVRLVPIFDNQTARGGVRAAFEIEVGDRWRGLIQKNFTLTEDTRFELEYLLSDEVSVRGIRDERRDVNTELEMRWKF